MSDEFNKYYVITVKGDSMTPLYPALAKIIAVSARNNIDIGDIIILRYFNSIIVHRVIFLDDKYVITKGDNNLHFDRKRSRGNILGKAVSNNKNNFKIARFSYLVGYIKDNFGRDNSLTILVYCIFQKYLKRLCENND